MNEILTMNHHCRDIRPIYQ